MTASVVRSELAGRCLRSYTFACRWCGDHYTVVSASTTFAVDKDSAEAKAHKVGWRWRSVVGWVCPDCRGGPPRVQGAPHARTG